jgi:hypothetical protein
MQAELQQIPNSAPAADQGAVRRPPTKTPPWHASVVADLVLSALAAGMFVFAAVGDLVAHDVYGPVARVAFLIAFPIMVADLIALVIDLGHPARFHHMLRVFKLNSPMSTGVWVISLFAFVSFVRAALALVDLPSTLNAGRIVDVVGIGPALFVGAYKGVLLSSTAQPGWKETRWLGAALSVSSGTLGAAVLILVSELMVSGNGRLGLRAALVFLLALELLFASVVLVELRPRNKSKANSSFLWLLLRTEIGLAVPLLLAIFFPSPPFVAGAAALTILNALAFRRDLIMIPHEAFLSGSTF